MLIGVMLATMAVGAPVANAADGTAGTPTTAAPQLAQVAPTAMYLCGKADAGKLGDGQLAKSATQIKAACKSFRDTFARIGSTYGATVTPLRAAGMSAVAAAAKTCKEAVTTHNTAACAAARTKALTTLRGLREKARAAGMIYSSSVGYARDSFWRTIRALPGGAALTADARTVVVAPPAGIPEDSAVNAAPTPTPAPPKPTNTAGTN